MYLGLMKKRIITVMLVYLGDTKIMINIASLSTLSAPLLLGASFSGLTDGDPNDAVIENFTQQYLNMTFLGNILTQHAYTKSALPH